MNNKMNSYGLNIGDKIKCCQNGEQTWKYVGQIATVVEIDLSIGMLTLEYSDGKRTTCLNPFIPNSERVYWERV
jgi:hypothetical protein